MATFLGVSPSRTVKVRMVEDELLNGATRMTPGAMLEGDDPEIYLGSSCLEPDLRQYILAHELGHWHMRAAGWSLPHLMEEALAEYLGLCFGPPGYLRARIEEIEREQIEADPAVLYLDVKQLAALAPSDRRRAVLSAFALARRIGFQRIPELAAAGRTSVEELHAAADL